MNRPGVCRYRVNQLVTAFLRSNCCTVNSSRMSLFARYVNTGMLLKGSHSCLQLEATRIRLVSQPGFAKGLVGGFSKILSTEGPMAFYGGFVPILFKQMSVSKLPSSGDWLISAQPLHHGQVCRVRTSIRSRCCLYWQEEGASRTLHLVSSYKLGFELSLTIARSTALNLGSGLIAG
jgi:hypothetical protein